MEKETVGRRGGVAMSTKIFNGYYIDKCSLYDLQSLSMNIRTQMEPVFERLYATKVLEIAISIADYAAMLDNGLYVRKDVGKEILKAIDDPKSSPLWSAKMIVDERSYKIERTQIRDMDYDFDCKITFVSIVDKILTMIFTEQKALQDVFESFSNVHRYGYWNNSDRPDDVSEEEWDQRAKDWDIVGIPAMVGLSIQCTPVYLPLLSWDLLFSIAQHPSYEARVNHNVFNMMLKQYIEENSAAEPRPADWFRLIAGTKEWMRTEAGQSVKAGFEDKVKSILKTYTLYPEGLTQDNRGR